MSDNNLPIKSSEVVSELKLNFIKSNPFILQSSSIVLVFDVPVGPSKITGISESNKLFIFSSLSRALGVIMKFSLHFD